MKRVPTIFIVDDEEGMCHSLQALLSNAGYKVACATTGESALKAVVRQDIDVFLSDIHMPGIDGFEFLEQILSQLPGTPVIMMTGDATVDSAVKALRMGAYDYLKKPFEPGEMLKTVENALQQRMLLERTRMLDNRLSLSERRFRFILQNSPDMIYTLDPSGRFKFVNESVAIRFGYQSADLVGKHYETMVWDEDISSARWRFNERRTGERATSGLALRLKPGPRQTDGTVDKHFTVVELFATGVYRQDKSNGQASLIGTYGVIRNLAHHTIRHEDPHSFEKLEEDISKILSGIGHDLNDILSSTRNVTANLMDKLHPDNPYLDQIRTIDRYTENGQYHARQLLWLANGGNLEPRQIGEKQKSRRVTFKLKAPNAKQVTLAGDFNGWDAGTNPLEKDSDGHWQTSMMLPSGRYEFKFMVDGQWRECSDNETTAPNRYGTSNNVIDVVEA